MQFSETRFLETTRSAYERVKKEVEEKLSSLDQQDESWEKLKELQTALREGDHQKASSLLVKNVLNCSCHCVVLLLLDVVFIIKVG